MTFCPWVRRGVYKRVLNMYKHTDIMNMQLPIKRLCTLMLLTNLAEPEWISVSCGQKIIADIVCVVPRNANTNANISLKAGLVIFKSPCVFINVKCYSFSWGFLNDRPVSRKMKTEIIKPTLVAMEHLVRVTNTEFPPFHSFFNLITYCKLLRKWISQSITEPHKGLHILTLSGSTYRKYGNAFECTQGTFIAYAYVCDGKKDCSGNIAFDEMGCTCETSFVLSRKC